MKTDKSVTVAQLAAYTRREHDLYRRIMDGSLPIEQVLAGLQALVEGKFTAQAKRTLADMLAAGKYDWVDPDITQKNFPVDPGRFTTEGCRVFHFNKVMTTAEVEAAIRAEGYEPDGIEKLLAYGAENSEEQRMYPIVGPGSSWVVSRGGRYVPYLYENGRERDVNLLWDGPSLRWRAHCRFLASPQVKR